MFSISNFEYKCNKNCNSKVHGNAITRALTKASVPDDKLASFIAKTCRNFAKICDSWGRSALYVACLTGRYSIVEWLLNHGALIDFKSGDADYTPLHCSLYYGRIDCAVLLMRYGANMEQMNMDYETPLQMIRKNYKVDPPEDVFADKDLSLAGSRKKKSRKHFVIPQLPAEEYTYESLLKEASESDTVHDITFYVDSKVFPAHKFIVFSRSKGLMKIVKQHDNKNVHLDFTGLTARMFELILKFIYSNYLISPEDLDDMLHTVGPCVYANRIEALNVFKEFVIKFELHKLYSFLESFDEDLQYFPKNAKLNFPPLKRTMFPELHDVVLKCANHQEIHIHKCVLVARSEYFNLMFNSGWAETSEVNLTTMPAGYMIPIIDFLYTLDADFFRKQIYCENFLCNMIVICDHFFFNRLRTVCEIIMLGEMSMRNCSAILELACSYGCELLERGCLEFICLNLANVLAQHSLESCEPKVLSKINVFHRDIFKMKFNQRAISPESGCIFDEKLIEFVSDFTVDLDYKTNNGVEPQMKLSNAKHNKRHYEKEAINWVRQISLDVDELDMSKTRAEIKELCEKAQSKSNKWIKIPKKIEVKRCETTTPLTVDQVDLITEESRVSPKIIVKKSPQTKRDYIKEATCRLRKVSLDGDEKKTFTSTTKSKTQPKIKELCDKGYSRSNNWIKVPKKIETNKCEISTEKKKSEKSSTKANAKFSSKTINSEKTDEENEGSINPCSVVSLIDFVKTEKLSKKQRNLLLSETSKTNCKALKIPTEPIYNIQNAETQKKISSVSQLPLQSFANIMKSQQFSKDSSKISTDIRAHKTPKIHAGCSPISSNPEKLVIGKSGPESLSFAEILK